jgi:hypothetical protein
MLAKRAVCLDVAVLAKGDQILFDIGLFPRVKEAEGANVVNVVVNRLTRLPAILANAAIARADGCANARPIGPIVLTAATSPVRCARWIGSYPVVPTTPPAKADRVTSRDRNAAINRVFRVAAITDSDDRFLPPGMRCAARSVRRGCAKLGLRAFRANITSQSSRWPGGRTLKAFTAAIQRWLALGLGWRAMERHATCGADTLRPFSAGLIGANPRTELPRLISSTCAAQLAFACRLNCSSHACSIAEAAL